MPKRLTVNLKKGYALNLKMVRNPHYRVKPSPWPPIVRVCLLIMALSLVFWIRYNRIGIVFMRMGGVLLICCLTMWWRDLLRENDQGYHPKPIVKCFRDAIGMFITSEVIFFISFFWAFFHRRLSPNVEVSATWPPVGIKPAQPGGLALLNTLLLLTRGATVNCAHGALKRRDYDYKSLVWIILTIVFSCMFVGCQFVEYRHNSFCISDGIYGRTFYMLTGFHGAHVFFGTVFLIVTLIRLWYGHFLAHQYTRFGFVACVWYWHFVDVVWIIVYLCVYLWGRGWIFNKWFDIKQKCGYYSIGDAVSNPWPIIFGLH